jgi:hypothetical protein
MLPSFSSVISRRLLCKDALKRRLLLLEHFAAHVVLSVLLGPASRAAIQPTEHHISLE